MPMQTQPRRKPGKIWNLYLHPQNKSVLSARAEHRRAPGLTVFYHIKLCHYRAGAHGRVMVVRVKM